MSVYRNVLAHRSMNFDSVRNPVYRRAILNTVTPDSVVLDLGAGLGMLGFLAAQAGARRVYLVEPEHLVEVTRRVAQDNGFDNVECIRATAESLELPEPADVILSVFTGNFLLSEDLLPSLFRARDRWLAPGGQLLPDRARMLAAPVSVPAFYERYVDAWTPEGAACQGTESYGIDYRAARPFAANTLYTDTAEQLRPRLLAKPARLAEFDFATATRAACDASVTFTANDEGVCHGFLGWFATRIGEEWLDTGPESPPTHWRPVLVPIEHPVAVERGQSIAFSLKRSEHGEWSWASEIGGRRQLQSTFLSEPLGPSTLRRRSEAFQPLLNDRGRALHYVLTRFDGHATVGEMADELARVFGSLFASRDDALRFVREAVDRHA